MENLLFIVIVLFFSLVLNIMQTLLYDKRKEYSKGLEKEISRMKIQRERWYTKIKLLEVSLKKLLKKNEKCKEQDDVLSNISHSREGERFAKKVYSFDYKGELICEYQSIRQASIKTKISRHKISKVLDTGSHIHGLFFKTTNKNKE